MLLRLRVSSGALVLAVAAWSAGCASQRPLIDPHFAARQYTPARIALMPPDIFMVYDQMGDNDPRKSAALGVQVTEQSVQMISQALRNRGYDVDLSAARDGVHGPDGAIILGGEELGWMANSILRFTNSREGGGQGTLTAPIYLAPEVAARVGWATRSDAILYVNIKGVAQSSGKRTAQVMLFAVIVVVVLLIILAETSSGSGQGRSTSTGNSPRTVRAAPATSATASPSVGQPTTGGFAAPVGHGRVPPSGGGRTYGGSNVSVGVGVVVPLSSPTYTHEGGVIEEDEPLGGDEVYASMTLVSAKDGRLLWHLRDNFDVEPDNPRDIQRFVDRIVSTLPPSLALPAPAK